MTTFLALYRGATITEAQIVAVSAEPTLVGLVATRLLGEPQEHTDPIVVRLERGRRAALRLVKQEAEHGD